MVLYDKNHFFIRKEDKNEQHQELPCASTYLCFSAIRVTSNNKLDINLAAELCMQILVPIFIIFSTYFIILNKQDISLFFCVSRVTSNNEVDMNLAMDLCLQFCVHCFFIVCIYFIIINKQNCSLLACTARNLRRDARCSPSLLYKDFVLRGVCNYMSLIVSIIDPRNTSLSYTPTIIARNCLRHSPRLVKRNSSSPPGNNATPERNNMVRGLRAPAVVDPRSPELLLRCEYDLGGNELYAVNWFRNEDVLFRYSPSLVPKATAYPGVADVNVSLEHSNAEQLLLIGHQDVQRNMKSYEGTYVCEVSTERPFLTDYGVANVSAAILPKANPVLEGLRHNYQVGEFLELACTSAPSLPPAELSFYLNGRKVYYII
ncbi:unnamed protein product [Trichogramma brassicae]|uniref:Ig-like domain-containing protein n=1 Tax=Trichogramma brassicae TaxID=86971 RepID=A0A6H5IPS1_9HYME|nr:unnamed protein product [Trichogramma brassicae]